MQQKILSFLQSQHFMAIATVSPENKPQVATMLYVIDQDFNIYFATHSSARKATNIAQNNAVALVIWEHNNLSIQIEGVADAVTNPQELQTTLQKLADAASGVPNFYPPVLRMPGQDYALFKVATQTCRYIDLKDENMKGYSAVVNEIKF
ncbi:pyridoxamine 5'-phosphate oxidase family protein [bacterium]|nr:pyridoxamine 5'-phosphate oxidase family protein [bacterium]PIQ78882.1 MAG: hypothetical protein COV81_03945 [Candidatus Peregrinibacteria bacterium CG11_big_fil_rev_8_21_14_0_20_41_10]PIZ77016.1 MAG: hypothetical protein COY06_01000 [Candidatus Peregrinibacteria bacterium CG_4_10_14_0_2_um_filter_41_8]PJC38272.1 MAG: hypothetical protein CO045_01175 [Candidatus Peregrinibacteria bacterium CG_4_9_14_0_2_um_filter_41_14]